MFFLLENLVQNFDYTAINLIVFYPLDVSMTILP